MNSPIIVYQCAQKEPAAECLQPVHANSVAALSSIALSTDFGRRCAWARWRNGIDDRGPWDRLVSSSISSSNDALPRRRSVHEPPAKAPKVKEKCLFPSGRSSIASFRPIPIADARDIVLSAGWNQKDAPHAPTATSPARSPGSARRSGPPSGCFDPDGFDGSAAASWTCADPRSYHRRRHRSQLIHI